MGIAICICAIVVPDRTYIQYPLIPAALIWMGCVKIDVIGIHVFNLIKDILDAVAISPYRCPYIADEVDDDRNSNKEQETPGNALIEIREEIMMDFSAYLQLFCIQ